MPKVYGVDVSKRAEKSANSFMHAQSGICGLSMLSALCSLGFTLIILHQIKKVVAAATTTADIPKEFAGWEAIMDKAWISALGQLAGACFVGSILVALGRKFVEDGQRGGMKLCCFLEGCCGCLGVMEVCALCGYLIFVMWAYSAMSNPATVCAGLSSISTLATTTAAPVARRLTDTSADATTTALASCEKWITALKPAMLTSVFFFLCMCLLSTTVTAFCLSGAKFANETAETFEDEEYGGEEDFDNDDY